VRLESIRLAEYLGSVKVHGVRRVLELDSSARTAMTKTSNEAQKVEQIYLRLSPASWSRAVNELDLK